MYDDLDVSWWVLLSGRVGNAAAWCADVLHKAGVRASSFTSVDHTPWSSEVPSGRGWISRALGVGGLDVRDGHLQAPHPSAGT